MVVLVIKMDVENVILKHIEVIKPALVFSLVYRKITNATTNVCFLILWRITYADVQIK
jgi:hypothetical protein